MVMNERIRDIKDKLWSEEYWNNPNTDKLLSAQLNRFAELIVRECIDIVSPYAIRMENFDGGHPIADLKKHFGVEE
jgi:hypothetical protein